MDSQYDQNQAQEAYPPPAGTNFVAPPPVGYPTKDDGGEPQNVPVETKSRGGDGFLKACKCILCCCEVLQYCVSG